MVVMADVVVLQSTGELIVAQVTGAVPIHDLEGAAETQNAPGATALDPRDNSVNKLVIREVRLDRLGFGFRESGNPLHVTSVSLNYLVLLVGQGVFCDRLVSEQLSVEVALVRLT